MDKAETAFRWIVGILQKHAIPFQVSGGLAARAYGASRPLADIDIDVPEERFDELLPEVSPYVVSGPKQYLDENWDVKLMTLDYRGQLIDLGGAYLGKIFDKERGVWMDAPCDFSSTEAKTIFDISVPVINRQDLIKYKRMLGRDVDKADIASLKQGINAP